MKIPHIICLGGSATIDQIFYVDHVPMPSAKIAAHEFVVTGGGVAANAAVAIQRLGGSASYWGRVGQDAWGDQVLIMLAKEGVNIQHLRQLAGYRTKISSVLIDAQGERLLVSSQPQGYPDIFDWLPLEQVAKAAAVTMDTRWIGGAHALMDEAFKQGIPAVLDGDGGEIDTVKKMVYAATHPVVSEPMLTKLSGQTIDSTTVDGALRSLFGGRNVMLGVTMGGQGTYWFDGANTHHLSSLSVQAVDTLAAGDTWHGAFTLALAEKKPIATAIEFANRAAALKCTKRGGRLGIPTRKEFNQFYAS